MTQERKMKRVDKKQKTTDTGKQSKKKKKPKLESQGGKEISEGIEKKLF